MEAFNVVVRFTADVANMVRGAQQAARSVDDVSEAEERTGRAAQVAASGTAQLSFEFGNAASSASDARNEVNGLNDAMKRFGLMRSGGITGGPPGKGFATDVGSAFRQASNFVQGLIGALTTILPTINIVIAGLVGIVSLLGAAAVAAAALTAALAATAAAMVFASFKWRDLLVQADKGAETWQGAFTAIQVEAFNMSKSLVASFGTAGEAGQDLWTSVGELGVKFLRLMEPLIAAIADRLKNFIDALNGVAGASSPFLEFIKRWVAEWKVLISIVNEGLPEGGGILGFFEKYEPAAKAFVEGIAKVINGIRKMSAMGLGLNMDQLADLIRNVFDWLAKMVQVLPKFTNSLVTVGLRVSEFLNEITPIISTAVEIGSAILEHIVAPLTTLALTITSKILSIPIVGWLASLAGGFALVAFAIAKLSFGLLPFTDILKKVRTAFVGLSANIGDAVKSMIGIRSETGTMGSKLLGGAIAVGVLAAAMYVLIKGMEEVDRMTKAVGEAFKGAFAQQVKGAATAIDTLATTYDKAQKTFNDLSYFGQVTFAVSHLDDVMMGHRATVILTEDAVNRLKEGYDGLLSDLQAGIPVGAPTDDLIAEAKALKEQFDYIASLGGNLPPLPNPKDMSIDEWNAAVAESTGAYEAAMHGAENYSTFLTNLDAAYESGIINAGQYAAWMELVGQKTNLAGEEVNLTALKVKGAALTISEALTKVAEDSDYATSALSGYAEATGQDFVGLRREVVGLMTDLANGVFGSGQKVNEFFLKQADLIAQWKTETAQSFDFVAAAMADLGTQTDLTFDDIKDTLQDALKNQMTYTQNLRKLVAMGASDALVQYVKDWGIAGADAAAALVEGGRKGINQVDKMIRKSGEQSKVIANIFGDALGVTLERLTAAITKMVAVSLGVSVNRVNEMIDHLIDKQNNAGENAKKNGDRMSAAMNHAAGRARYLGHQIDYATRPRTTIIDIDISRALEKLRQLDAASRGSHHSYGGGGGPHPQEGHSGGQVTAHGIYHAGGLAHDEMSAKLQLGEYVISRKAVNAYGLNVMRAINQMRARVSVNAGAPQVQPAASPVNAPLGQLRRRGDKTQFDITVKPVIDRTGVARQLDYEVMTTGW